MTRQRHSQSLLHLDPLLSPQSRHTETEHRHTCIADTPVTTHGANSQKKGHVHVSIAELLQPFGLTPRVFDRARDRAH